MSAPMLYLNQWAGTEHTLTTEQRTCAHAECDVDAHSWRHKHAAFESLAAVFDYLLCFFPLWVCFDWILSAVAGTLSKCLYLFLFILFLTSSHSCLYTHYTLWMFGAAATTFPSAHACSHVLQEHTHFGAEPWISGEKKRLSLHIEQQTPALWTKSFRCVKKGTARIFNIHFKVDNAADK